MSKYKCNRCEYQTNNKTHYDDHLNRKIPCNPNKPHKLIKNNIVHHCLHCNEHFSRKDSLTRHNKTYHAEINGNENNIGQINGNDNKQIIGNNNNLIDTQINNPIIIQPIIHPYDYRDLNDLTLYEQYLSLTSKDSPYTALLDHLNLNPAKPQYHNINVANINRNTIDIHNGQKWIKEIMNNALSNVVTSERIMIGMIFNRFRYFLSKKATNLIPKSYYYGFVQNYYFHKKIIQHIKVHLYNNRDIDNKSINEEIPYDNDPVFWALSKKFTWDDVTTLITKMDKLNIDFDKNLDDIKNQLLSRIKEKPKLDNFFKKLLKHINKLINDFKTTSDSEISSSSEENSE